MSARIPEQLSTLACGALVCADVDLKLALVAAAAQALAEGIAVVDTDFTVAAPD